MVYLTSSNGMALNHAIRISERVHNAADITVLEIDTSGMSQNLFYPDEDWVKEVRDVDFDDWDVHEQYNFLEEQKHYWMDSLREMETVAYRGVVPPSTITIVPLPVWEVEHRRIRAAAGQR